MFVSFLTVSVTTLVTTDHLSVNPIKECLTPVVTQATQCLTLVVNATVQVLNNLATIGSTPDEHLWYSAPDYQRFTEDVLHEAREAGCKSPASQYQHYRSNYLDDITIRNTELNVQQGSAPAALRLPTITLTTTIDTASSPARKRREHRRSVSWSKELHQVLSPCHSSRPDTLSAEPVSKATLEAM
eukprot:m.22014 g.22014  ORF g.22014 m.22014 type:complete len:186 (+) comp10612_c0_seq1:555-1112(+)